MPFAPTLMEDPRFFHVQKPAARVAAGICRAISSTFLKVKTRYLDTVRRRREEYSRAAYPCSKAQVATAAGVSSGVRETPLATSSRRVQRALPAPEDLCSDRPLQVQRGLNLLYEFLRVLFGDKVSAIRNHDS
jgi:hypothetical protein